MKVIHRWAVAALLAVSAAPAAMAAAKDYQFELVQPAVKAGASGVVKARLVHLPDKAPVPDAVIFQTRFDMGPDGMATMTAPIKAVPAAGEPGVYTFQVEPSMAGNWAITLAAKVQGEPETVRGTLTLPVSK